MKPAASTPSGRTPEQPFPAAPAGHDGGPVSLRLARRLESGASAIGTPNDGRGRSREAGFATDSLSQLLGADNIRCHHALKKLEAFNAGNRGESDAAAVKTAMEGYKRVASAKVYNDKLARPFRHYVSHMQKLDDSHRQVVDDLIALSGKGNPWKNDCRSGSAMEWLSRAIPQMGANRRQWAIGAVQAFLPVLAGISMQASRALLADAECENSFGVPANSTRAPGSSEVGRAQSGDENCRYEVESEFLSQPSSNLESYLLDAFVTYMVSVATFLDDSVEARHAEMDGGRSNALSPDRGLIQNIGNGVKACALSAASKIAPLVLIAGFAAAAIKVADAADGAQSTSAKLWSPGLVFLAQSCGKAVADGISAAALSGAGWGSRMLTNAALKCVASGVAQPMKYGLLGVRGSAFKESLPDMTLGITKGVVEESAISLADVIYEKKFKPLGEAQSETLFGTVASLKAMAAAFRDEKIASRCKNALASEDGRRTFDASRRKAVEQLDALTKSLDQILKMEASSDEFGEAAVSLKHVFDEAGERVRNWNQTQPAPMSERFRQAVLRSGDALAGLFGRIGGQDPTSPAQPVMQLEPAALRDVEGRRSRSAAP